MGIVNNGSDMTGDQLGKRGSMLDIMGSQVRVGTSGYSFDDWKGPFYPPGMARGDMLAYYAQHFDTVEINSTYYRIFPPSVFESMVARTPRDFLFSVKLNSSMTHERNATAEDWAGYHAMLAPMIDGGKLSGLLAQFPYSFRPSEENISYLLTLPERVRGLPLVVEFRNDAWYDMAILDRITSAGMGLVSVDLPRLGHLPPRVPIGGRPFGYVRFHGRNDRKWWDGGELRYDYSYNRQELGSWLPALRWLTRRSDTLFLYFNNCHAGKAVDSAMIMDEILREEAS